MIRQQKQEVSLCPVSFQVIRNTLLLLTDSISRILCSRDVLLKTLPDSFVRIPLPSPKRSGSTGWMMYIPDGFSTTLTTSVPDASAVVKPMSAVRSSSATRNALPASNAVRCVLLLSKSSADVLTRFPTSATAVRNPAAAVPFPINIFTMPALHIVSMMSFALLPGRASISPAMRRCR